MKVYDIIFEVFLMLIIASLTIAPIFLAIYLSPIFLFAYPVIFLLDAGVIKLCKLIHEEQAYEKNN